MDDVQLIQILINLYIDATEDIIKDDPTWTARLDKPGRVKLDVDGICGPLTLAAILAVQKSLKIWKGCTVDGRVDAIPEGGASQYPTGESVSGTETVSNKVVPYRIMLTRFNTMYMLGVMETWSSGIHMDVHALPDPLKSSLLRSTIDNGVGSFLKLELTNAMISS